MYARSLLREWDTAHLETHKEQAVVMEAPKLAAVGMTLADGSSLLRSILYPEVCAMDRR